VRLTADFVGRYLAEGAPPGELLVCVGFTDLARTERFDPGTATPGADPEAGWQLLKPALSRRRHGADRAGLAANRAYYAYIFSELQAAISFLQQVLLLQELLSRHGIPHYFHDALDTNHEPLWRWGNQLENLLQLVRPQSHRSVQRNGTRGRFAADRSFEHWSECSGLALAPGRHPLSAGHEDWARLLYEEMMAIGTLS
jgi:hypothetical protein